MCSREVARFTTVKQVDAEHATPAGPCPLPPTVIPALSRDPGVDWDAGPRTRRHTATALDPGSPLRYVGEVEGPGAFGWLSGKTIIRMPLSPRGRRAFRVRRMPLRGGASCGIRRYVTFRDVDAAP
jgi:hypothetical protein